MVKISVIVPVYNVELDLKQSLDSIVNQTFKDIEIILIDDGSTDRSYSICQEYQKKDKRIRLFQQRNIGLGATRKKYIPYAKGKYILFLDSDDFFELDMIEEIYNRAETTNTEVILFDFWQFDVKEKKDIPCVWGLRKELLPQKQIFSWKDCPEKIFQICSPNIWSKFFTRDFLLKNRDCFSNARRCEDLLTWVSLLPRINKISVLPFRLVHYKYNRIGNLSFSGDQYYNVYSREIIKILYDLRNQKEYIYYANSLEKAILNAFLDFHTEHFKYPIRNFSKNNFWNSFHSVLDAKILMNDKEKIINRIGFFNSKRSEKISVLENKYINAKHDIIPIVFAVNEKQLPCLGVALQSIIENSSDNKFYDIYILHHNLSQKNIYNLENFGKENILINCLDATSILPKTVVFSSNEIEIKAFCLLIPFLFTNYDKVLYLEPNIICQSDLSKIFEIDMKDNLMAGNLEQFNKAQYFANIEPHEIYNCINTGLLMWNIKQWTNVLIDECWETIVKNPSVSAQTTLNHVCKNRIMNLNFIPNLTIKIIYDGGEKHTNIASRIDIPSEHEQIIYYKEINQSWRLEKSDPLWLKYARNSIFYEKMCF